MNSVAALFKLVMSMSAAGTSVPLTPSAAMDVTSSSSFVAGTASAQCDVAFAQQGTLTTGQQITITLTAVTDCFNVAATLGHVKALALINNGTAGSGSLLIGGTANNYAGIPSAMTVTPGSFIAQTYALDAGQTVTAATGDKLTIKNNSTLNQPYTVLIAGTST